MKNWAPEGARLESAAAAAVVAAAATAVAAVVVAASAEEDENENEPENVVAVIVVAEHGLILSSRDDFFLLPYVREYSRRGLIFCRRRSAPHRHRLILCSPVFGRYRESTVHQ